jgi:hypothetical protein
VIAFIVDIHLKTPSEDGMHQIIFVVEALKAEDSNSEIANPPCVGIDLRIIRGDEMNDCEKICEIDRELQGLALVFGIEILIPSVDNLENVKREDKKIGGLIIAAAGSEAERAGIWPFQDSDHEPGYLEGRLCSRNGGSSTTAFFKR